MLAPLFTATMRLPCHWLSAQYFLMPGDRERARGFDDRARVFEDVLDAGADFVGVHQHDFVDVLAAQAERFLADPLHRHAVGEDADALQRHALPGAQRIVHGRGVHRLDADDPDLGIEILGVHRDAGDQAAAADRHEDRVEVAARLAQDFHARWCPAPRSRPDRRRDARTRGCVRARWTARVRRRCRSRRRAAPLRRPGRAPRSP